MKVSPELSRFVASWNEMMTVKCKIEFALIRGEHVEKDQYDRFYELKCQCILDAFYADVEFEADDYHINTYD